jgi:ppGpp synthetase/RelA/SpoT-type nucleotidyltranferase
MPSNWDLNWDQLDNAQKQAVQENVELYERVRPALKLVTRDVLLTLRSMLKDTEVTPLFVTGRTKTVESFREKISRTEEPLEPGGPPVLKFPDPFRTLNDMVGVRVITKLPAENAVVANLIKRQRQLFDCRGDREKDIGSIESGTYGYSSRHLILRTIQNDAVKDYQQAFNPDVQPNGSYFFECQIRTVFAHAWSEIEHDIRFKAEDPRAWTPHFDRQFTATAAMLETVETAFADLHERYEEVRSFWDTDGEGAAPLTPNRIRDVWTGKWTTIGAGRRNSWQLTDSTRRSSWRSCSAPTGLRRFAGLWITGILRALTVSWTTSCSGSTAPGTLTSPLRRPTSFRTPGATVSCGA